MEWSAKVNRKEKREENASVTGMQTCDGDLDAETWLAGKMESLRVERKNCVEWR